MVFTSIYLMFCYLYVYDLESHLDVQVISLPSDSLGFMYLLASPPCSIVLLVYLFLVLGSWSRSILKTLTLSPILVVRNSQWGGGCFRGLGAEPPALENFAFFSKITKF